MKRTRVSCLSSSWLCLGSPRCFPQTQNKGRARAPFLCVRAHKCCVFCNSRRSGGFVKELSEVTIPWHIWSLALHYQKWITILLSRSTRARTHTHTHTHTNTHTHTHTHCLRMRYIHHGPLPSKYLGVFPRNREIHLVNSSVIHFGSFNTDALFTPHL